MHLLNLYEILSRIYISGVDVPVFVLLSFSKESNSININETLTSYRPTVVNAQCIIDSAKNPDAGIDCFYGFDK